MGIKDLQAFLESTQISGSSTSVDLLKIARYVATKQSKSQHRGKGANSHLVSPQNLSLVVDGECCLDRLYGGYFSDWVCGGQWNRMVQFLAVLIQTIQSGNIELAVFFNGCLEQQRMGEWVAEQQKNRHLITQVLKHVNNKGTPPPKVWWNPPVCLRTCLRMALRHLNVSVVCTMDDHHQEVIAYCRENYFHGIMADDGEYAVFDPPRYFSSEHLKLTYKGSLETREYMLNDAAKILGISSDRFCLMAALLGNYLLIEHDLAEFYRSKLNIKTDSERTAEVVVKKVAAFVKDLPSIENMDAVGAQVFGSASDYRTAKLKQCVQYYMNGTKEGFLRYRPQSTSKKNSRKSDVHSKPVGQTVVKTQQSSEETDSSKFASETLESENESLQLYKVATANAKSAPEIVIDPPACLLVDDSKGDESYPVDNHKVENKQTNQTGTTVNGTANHSTGLLLSSSSSSSSSSATSPSRLTPENSKSSENSSIKASLLAISPEVMRTASERHQKGLMSPYIYQILTQGEIKLPVLMEDELHKELPDIHLLFRPVRQMVYAILFNLYHQVYLATKGEGEKDKKAKIPEVTVREWIWSKNNCYNVPDMVKAELIGWAVPTIQRLWFGSAIDDKRRRLRAFLTCMRSDTQLMLNPGYVPQHLLVMATVLRYIMSFPEKKILRKQELDAFIVTAFSPQLMNTHYLQELQLPLVTSRGIQLAAMFMQGVETALLANDACGAPIPWLMCCPWLFFDGKLFHHKLSRTSVVKNILELCDHNIDHLVKVERMKQAILEGIKYEYARPPLPMINTGVPMGGIPPNPLQTVIPAGRGIPIGRGSGFLNGVNGTGSSRGLLRRPIPARGGQLEIAGVVVGNWGPNYGSRQGIQGTFVTHRGSRIVPPQVTSVGSLKNSRQNFATSYHVGGPRTSFNPRAGKIIYGKSKKPQGIIKKKGTVGTKKIIHREAEKKEPKGRGLAIEADCGDTLNSSEVMKNGIDDDENVKSEAVGQFDDAETIVKSMSKLGMHEGQGDGPHKGVVTLQN